MAREYAQGKRWSVIAAGSRDNSEVLQHAKESQLGTRQRPEEEELPTKWKKGMMETVLVKFLKTSSGQQEFYQRAREPWNDQDDPKSRSNHHWDGGL